MPITSADCKNILEQDPLLRSAGATKEKAWKRLSKKKGALGVERIFVHPAGLYARLVEAGDVLWIGAAATTMEELDDPINQRTVVAVKPSAADQPWYMSAEAPAAKAAIARKHVDEMISADEDGGEDADDLYQNAVKLNPVALANQYTFAIFKNSEDSVIASVGACITPTSVWVSEGYCHDQPSPLDHLMPSGSEDLNECGTWVVAGFEDRGPLDLATFLLARGFRWDRKFQDFIDSAAGEALLPIDQARQGSNAPSI